MPLTPSTDVDTALPRGEENVAPGFSGDFASAHTPPLEDHHNVPRSRGGSGKRVNLSPIDPDRHDRYHEFAGNALPSEMLRMLATDAVGYARHRTIAPYQLRTIYEVAHVADWSEIYKGKAVVPSGTVEAFENHPNKFYLHATRHQVAELFHIDGSLEGLAHGSGYGWEKANLLRQACRFFDTPDDPMGAMRQLLTERFKGSYTWVDSLEDDVRETLTTTLESSGLVELTRGVSMELRGIVAKQRSEVAAVYHRWAKAYQDRYGNRGKKRERSTAMRSYRPGRH